MRLRAKIGIGLGLLLLAAVGAGIAAFGPRNVIGMIRYDERQEGRLRVGDRAPDVSLVSLDGAARTSIASRIGKRPLVLVFGSYT